MAALLAISCTKPDRPRQAEGLGRLVAGGSVVAVKPSPSGAFVAWLTACGKVSSGVVAVGTQSCELRVAPTSGGEAMVVAKGVTTLPHGFVWADGQTLLALEHYEHATGEGTLVAWEGAPRQLAGKVKFYAATPDGRGLGWVADGVLSVLDRGPSSTGAGDPAKAGPSDGAGKDGAAGGFATGGGVAPVSVGQSVATFEFAPTRGAGAGVTLLARRESRAGGDLLVLASGKLTPVAARTAEYRFSPAGDFAYTVRQGATDALAFARASMPTSAVSLRGDVHSFHFAPDGSAIAFISDVAPGKQGDLWVARVGDAGRPSTPEKIASGVGEVRWAPKGGALAWLADFDPGMRSGALTVRSGPGAAPRRLAAKVSAYEFSPDGRAVAFLEHVIQGGYSVDLRLARLDAERGAAPGAGAESQPKASAADSQQRAAAAADSQAQAAAEPVARGVFGFDFAPENDFLYYRTACVQNGESCNLERIPVSGLAAGEKPQLIAEGVKSFDFDRRTRGRLLLSIQRPDGTPVGLAVWREGKLTSVDRGLVPGSAAFLAPDSSLLVYGVQEKGRDGLYLAQLGE